MADTFRYFLDIAYKGTQYHGWQIQHNALTVQEVLNDRLGKLIGQSVNCVASGRTDTGVHARQQVIHFDTLEPLERESFLYKLNAFLPGDIAASNMRRVKSDAHARFDALERSYEYHLIKRKDPFREGLVYYFRYDLNTALMNEACAVMMTYEDFECFSRTKTEVNHFLCDIRNAEWMETDDGLIFRITANRFLRGMVRAIVGTMIEIGKDKIDLDHFRAIIESKDRRKAAMAAPPEGLFLSKIIYPNDIYVTD